MFNTFVKIDDNAKWILICIFFVFILLFVLIGAIATLIKIVMGKQGDTMECLIADVVNHKVITDGKKLRKYGIRKNFRQLFKDAWIPMLILFSSSFIYLIYAAIFNFDVNLFGWERNASDSNGVGSLFFILNWSDPSIRGDFFFLHDIVVKWPPCIHTPTWDWNAWGSYIFALGVLVGGLWFLWCVQAYIARTFRLFKISKNVFKKKIDVNPNEAPVDEIKPE